MGGGQREPNSVGHPSVPPGWWFSCLSEPTKFLGGLAGNSPGDLIRWVWGETDLNRHP